MFDDLILLWNPEPPRAKLRETCLHGQPWDCICRTLQRRFETPPFTEPDAAEPTRTTSTGTAG